MIPGKTWRFRRGGVSKSYPLLAHLLYNTSKCFSKCVSTLIIGAQHVMTPLLFMNSKSMRLIPLSSVYTSRLRLRVTQRLVSMIPSGGVYTWHVCLHVMQRMGWGSILCICICVTTDSMLKLTLMQTHTQTSRVNRTLGLSQTLV